jgi:CMP-N,N'-diacetyllegionaminic acid synthase
MNIAVIPARGGSKGLPQKNIKLFAGHPLIAWSILQAKNCVDIESVWVTSDCEDILNIAEKYGAKAIRRPDELATDTASSESAWIHAVQFAQNQLQQKINYVFGLQPTSPLRQSADFTKALLQMQNDNSDSLFSSVEIEDYFIWKNQNQSMIGVNHDYQNRKRRQNIEKKYLENGSFYIFRPQDLIQFNNRLSGQISTYCMEGYKRFQIDSLEDFTLCEVIMKGYKLNQI